MNLVLGIDPGGNGALAVVTDTELIECIKMPETEREVWDAVVRMRSHCVGIDPNIRAVIEDVHSMPAQGVSSAFTFGKNVGLIRMALIGNGYKFVEVLPTRWKKAMQVQTGGFAFDKDGKKTGVGAKKDYTLSRAKAQQLFPTTKIVNWNCEALLIAAYGRQLIVEGKL